jgi:hypothetical protein
LNLLLYYQQSPLCGLPTVLVGFVQAITEII